MILPSAICRQALFFCLVAECSLLDLSLIARTDAHPAAPSARRNLPDSFLPTPAASVKGLLDQIHTKPVVRRRYARYFHIPESSVAAYLQAHLVQKRLGESGLYTVFLVRPNGLVYPALLTLPKGSFVFALKNGAPVLTGQDGNPVVRYHVAVENEVAPSGDDDAGKSAPSVQTVLPAPVQTTVVATPVATPVYQTVPSNKTGDPSTRPAEKR